MALICPRCKFPIREGDTCLLCQTPVSGFETAEMMESAEIAPHEAKLLGWLCCDPFQPQRIDRSLVRLTLGRDDDCDLTLPHHSISRCHGVIRLVEDQIQFEDTSSNGSFLNGKRVASSLLTAGDVLTIGPYDLELRDELPQARGDSTAQLDYGLMVSGLLEETPISETLQGLEFNKKTGTLALISGRLRGNLVVREGEPWLARLGDLLDEEAVLGMLALREGRFVFSPSPEAGRRRMKGSLTSLLLEGSRLEEQD